MTFDPNVKPRYEHWAKCAHPKVHQVGCLLDDMEPGNRLTDLAYRMLIHNDKEKPGSTIHLIGANLFNGTIKVVKHSADFMMTQVEFISVLVWAFKIGLSVPEYWVKFFADMTGFSSSDIGKAVKRDITALTMPQYVPNERTDWHNALAQAIYDFDRKHGYLPNGIEDIRSFIETQRSIDQTIYEDIVSIGDERVIVLGRSGQNHGVTIKRFRNVCSELKHKIPKSVSCYSV